MKGTLRSKPTAENIGAALKADTYTTAINRYVNVKIGNNGFTAINKPKNAVFAVIADFGAVSTADAINVAVGNNSSTYIIGTAGVTITSIDIMFFFKAN